MRRRHYLAAWHARRHDDCQHVRCHAANVSAIRCSVGCLSVIPRIRASSKEIGEKDSTDKWRTQFLSFDWPEACVKALIAAGAHVNVQNAAGGSALLLSAENGYADCVKALLVAHADVNAKDEYNNSPLFYAAQVGQVSVVKALIALQADVNVIDNDGDSPLIYAALGGNAGCVEALISARANVNVTAYTGDTALSVAKTDEIKSALRAAGEHE